MERRFLRALTPRLTRAILLYSFTSGGARQRPSSLLIRLTSALATCATPERRRIRREDFPSSRWRLPAGSATYLPLPVRLTRFPIPVWGFIFGIVKRSPLSLAGVAGGSGLLGRRRLSGT